MDLMSLMVRIGADTREAESGISRVSKLGKSLSSTFKTVVKGMGVAITAAAGAVTVLTKSAIDAYGEFEQLSGGAELMYGKAYDSVMERAKNAYSEVQMSQNDYLRQVNGFATGLKTSLGGNEKAAADLAHKIVVAEADIVAATGNTQESIQNAFNGIMRSNFSMLDNLQIGITPTKEGFQEVIDKVNEWNTANGHATKYQMDNLADMENALVDYIQMVGYSGYAHNEAAGTIQGSLASMKAAWQNLIIEMAAGNSDFTAQMDALVKTAGNALSNILPVVTNFLTGFGDLIARIGPIIVEKLPQIIQEVVPSLLNAAVAIVGSLAAALPGILEALIVVIGSFVDSISAYLNEHFPAAGAVFDAFVATVSGAFDAIKGFWENTLKPVLLDLWSYMTDTVAPALIEVWTNTIEPAIGGAMQGISDFWTNTLQPAFAAFWSFVTETLAPAITTAWTETIQPAVVGAMEGISSFWEGTLRPAFEAIWGWLTNTLGEAFGTLAAAIGGDEQAMAKLNDVLNVAIPIVVGLATAFAVYKGVVAISGLIDTLRNSTSLLSGAQAILNAVMSANPFAIVAGVIAGLTAAFIYLWNTNSEFRDAVIRIWTAIKNTAESIWNKVQEIVVTVWETIQTKATEIWDSISTFFVNTWGTITADINNAWLDIKHFFETTWENISSTITEVWNAIAEFFSTTWETVSTAITTAWEAITEFFSTTWETISDAITTAWDAISEFFATTWETISTAITTAWDAISTYFSTTWETISTAITEAWDAVSEFFSTTWENINTTLTTAWDAISTYFTTLWETISTAISTAWVAITTFFSDTWDSINTTLTTTWDSISEFLSTTWDTLSTGASTLFSNIKSFMETYLQPVYDWLTGTFSPVFDAVKTAINALGSWLSDTFSGDWKSAWEGIVNGFGSIWGKITSFLSGPINAVIDMINGMISAVEGAINSVIGGINKALRISIPAKTFNVFGQEFGFPGWSWSVNLSTVKWGRISHVGGGSSGSHGGSGKRFAEGGWLAEGWGWVGEFGPERLDVSNGVATVTPADANPYAGLEAAIERAVATRLDTIIEKISKRLKVYLDKETLVGEIIDEVDYQLDSKAEWSGGGRA